MTELNVEMLLKLAELSGKTPKQPDLVLFLGRNGGDLIDNGKHCYLESLRGGYKFKSLFYTKHPHAATTLADAGLPCLRDFDFELLSRVAVIVCDDFHWRGGVLDYMTRGAKVFQLWHGIPLKSIGMIQAAIEHQNMPPERKRWIEFGYGGYDAVLSTSEYVSREIFSQVFGTCRFVNLGYPRNDVLLRPTARLDKLDMINVPKAVMARLHAHRRAGGRVMAYMPTFRDYNAQGEMNCTQNSGHYLDIQAMSDFGRKRNVLFMLKYHPYVADIPEKMPENCVFCPHSADVYPLLRFADMLLTDYSSVYFDYLLLNRPVHYFVPDKEEYEAKDRKFMLNFDDWTPGHKSRTQDECFAVLEDVLNNNMNDGMEGERLKMRGVLFDHHDDQAAVRCCKFVEEMLES